MVAARRWLVDGGPEPAPSTWSVEPAVADLTHAALRLGARAAAGGQGDGEPLTAALAGRVSPSILRFVEALLRRAWRLPPEADPGGAHTFGALTAAAAAWPPSITAAFHQVIRWHRDDDDHATLLFTLDTARQVVHLLALMLVERAWRIVAALPGRPTSPQERAAADLLKTLCHERFSMGAAVTAMFHASFAPLWHEPGPPLPQLDDRARRGLVALATSRNEAAHGTASRARGSRADVSRLVEVLTALDPWLGACRRWMEDQRLHSAQDCDGWVGRPAPILWWSDGQEWWLDHLTSDGVYAANPRGACRRVASLDGFAPLLLTIIEAPVQKGDDLKHMVWPNALLAALTRQVDAGGHAWIVGSSGTGKSVLARMLERRISGAVVLGHRPPVGRPSSADELRASFSGQLRARGLRLPGPRGHPRPMPADPADAAAWWAELHLSNPELRVVLVVDGADDCDDPAGLIAWVAAQGQPTVVTTRRTPGDPPPAGDGPWPGAPKTLTLDLDRWYRADGRAGLRSWLRTHHPALRKEHTRILELAQGRFGWVRHFALGLEAGVAPDRDPQRYAAAHLARVEQRLGGTTGLRTCLRRVLLTLAETQFPLSRALLHRLVRPPSGDEPWAALVGPVLAQIGDLVDAGAHRRIDGSSDDHDAVYGAERPVALTIAHAALSEVLRDGPLDERWSEDRRIVRARLAEHTRTPSAAAADPPSRYALVRGLTHQAAAGVDPDTSLAHALTIGPSDAERWASPDAPLWAVVARARWEAARQASPALLGEAARQYARALLAVGSHDAARHLARTAASSVDGSPEIAAPLWLVAAIAASMDLRHEDALQSLDRIVEGAGDVLQVQLDTERGWILHRMHRRADARAALDAAVRRALAMSRDGALGCGDDRACERATANALDGRGYLRAQAKDPSFVEDFDASQEIWRRLAASGEPGALRDLGVSLRRLGAGWRVIDPPRAIGPHQEEVTLARRLAPRAATLHEAVARHPQGARDLALALGNMGQALAATGDAEGAAAAHQEEVQWFEVLADGAVVHGVCVRPRALRELAFASGNLGLAWAATQDRRAVQAMERASTLLRITHGLPPDLAARDAPGPALRDVAIADLRLAEVLLGFGEIARARALIHPIEDDAYARAFSGVLDGLARCRRAGA